MKKRLLSMLLAVIMIFSIVPISAFAAPTTHSIQVTYYKYVVSSGIYASVESLPKDDNTIYVGDTIEVTLENQSMSNRKFSITSDNTNVIAAPAESVSAGKTTLECKAAGTTTLTFTANNKSVSIDVTVTANCDHEFGGDYLFDGTNHWQKCQKEGCDVTSDPVAHSVGETGTGATCLVPAVCGTCKQSFGALADHVWDDETEWKSDTTGHWQECETEGCTVKRQEAPVAHTEDYKDNTDGTHDKYCTVCNFVIIDNEAHNHDAVTGKCVCGNDHVHTPGTELKNDDTHHWYVCTECQGAVNKVEHTEGTAATCTAKAVCSVCLQSYGELAEHTIIETEWKNDEANHWHVCQAEGCGAIVGSEIHEMPEEYTKDLLSHSKTCADCGYVAKAKHDYNEETNTCECGAVNPGSAKVELNADVADKVELIPVEEEVDTNAVPKGFAFQFKIALKNGYAVAENQNMIVKVNGEPVTPDENGVYTASIADNTTITVENIVKAARNVTVTYVGADIPEAEKTQTIEVLNTASTIPVSDLKLPTGYQLARSITEVKIANDDTATVEVMPQTFTVTLAEGTRGVKLNPYVTYDANGVVTYGGNFTFQLAIDEAFEGSPVLYVNDYIAPLPLDGDDWYRLTNIREDQIITVTGIQEKTKDVTVTYVDTKGTNQGEQTIKVNYTDTEIAEDQLELPANYKFYSAPDLEIGANNAITVYVTLETFTVTALGDGFELEPIASKYDPDCVVYDTDFRFAINVLPEFQTTDAFQVYVNGVPVETEAYTYYYEIKDVRQNQVVTVEGVERIPTSVVVLNEDDSSEGVSIVPRSGYNADRVEAGNSFKFKVKLDKGFIATNLTVMANDKILTPNASGVYTIKKIYEDQEILITGVMEETTHTVVLDAEGVTMTTSGDPEAVKTGKNFQFSLDVLDGYMVEDEMIVMANDEIIEPNVFGVYTIKNITEDQEITVAGVEEILYYDVVLDEEIDGVTLTPKKKYASLQVQAGGDFRFTVEIEDGYVDDDMVVYYETTEDELVPITPNALGVYIIKNIQEDLEVSVIGVEKEPVYEMTIVESDGVTITPKKGFDPENVKPGEKFKFTVEVEEGYDDSNMQVLAVSETDEDEKVIKPNINGVYVLKNISDNMYIIVTGVEEIPTYEVKLNEYASSDGVSIEDYDGYDAENVVSGENFKFTVEVASGYDATNMIVKAYIGGGNGKILNPSSSGVYTVKNVTDDVEIVITGVCNHVAGGYRFNSLTHTHALFCKECDDVMSDSVSCTDKWNVDGKCDYCDGKLNNWWIPSQFLFWL